MPLDLWGFTISTALDWLIFAVILVAAVVLYFSLVVFIRRYTTGIVGGFILALMSFALMIWPAYQLIFHETTFAQMLIYGLFVAAGCITLAVAAYKLTNFRDF
jgi:hypothetical protein